MTRELQITLLIVNAVCLVLLSLWAMFTTIEAVRIISAVCITTCVFGVALGIHGLFFKKEKAS
jgi:hypothetical protein